MNRLQKTFLTSAAITFAIVVSILCLFRMQTFAQDFIDNVLYAMVAGVTAGVWDVLGKMGGTNGGVKHE